MSDDLRYILILTEGPHDVAAISKVLGIRGYVEINVKDEIPEALQITIPTAYPFKENGWMDRGVPRPCFMKDQEDENRYIVIKGVGGFDKIGEGLSDFLVALYRDAQQMLQGIAIVADMDQDTPSKRQNRIRKQLRKAEGLTAEMNAPLEGTVSIEENNYPLRLFFFPDSHTRGTLENLLLDGASVQYPDLHSNAVQYIDEAKKNYRLENSDDLKATVGVIANVLKPGKANQVSIQDNDWFTEKSLGNLPSHIPFAEFLDSLMALFE